MIRKLSNVNLAIAEEIVRRGDKTSVHEAQGLSQAITIPLSTYLIDKLESYRLNEKMNWLFAEFVFFCPYDMYTPWELLDFSLAFSMTDKGKAQAEGFFHKYHTLTAVLQSEGRTVIFSPCFRAADNWEGNFEITLSENLSSFNDENLVRKYKEALGKNSEAFNPFQLSKDSISYDAYFLALTGDRLEVPSGAFSQVRDVPETHITLHSLLHQELGTANKTVFTSVPLYILDPHTPMYIVAGAFFLFGELLNLNTSTENFLTDFKKFSSEIRQEFIPIVAGYAYHRSRDRQFEEMWANIRHELKGIPPLIDKRMPKEVLEVVQNIILMHFAYSRSSDTRQYPVGNYAGKPLCKLIDYLLSNSLLSELARCQRLSPTMSEEDITAEIKRHQEEFKQTCTVVYEPDTLKDCIIQESNNIGITSVLFMAAMNNTLQNVDSESPKIVVLISKSRVRITNSKGKSENKPYGRTRQLLERRITEYGKIKNGEGIIFKSISKDELTENELSLWNTHCETHSDSEPYLWVTQFPIVLDTEGQR